jgi:hypothetical protein
MTVNLIFAPYVVPNISYTTIEAQYTVVTLQSNMGDPPSSSVGYISSLFPTGSLLYQYNGGCPGTAITHVPAKVTDSSSRVCAYGFPSSVYPTNTALPPNSGSGEYYVGNVSFTYYMNATGQISPNHGVVTIQCVNHLFASGDQVSQFQGLPLFLLFPGTNYAPGASQIFDVLLDSLPSVGDVLIEGDNATALVGQPYNLGNTSLFYILTIISPGMVQLTYTLREQNVRAWESFVAAITITNLNTPQQPYMTFPIIDSTGFPAFTFNAVRFNASIHVADLANWPATRLLHLSMIANQQVGFDMTFCIPYNITQLIFHHLDFEQVCFCFCVCLRAALRQHTPTFNSHLLPPPHLHDSHTHTHLHDKHTHLPTHTHAQKQTP